MHLKYVANMWSLRPKVDSPKVASPVQTTPYNTAYKRWFFAWIILPSLLKIGQASLRSQKSRRLLRRS